MEAIRPQPRVSRQNRRTITGTKDQVGAWREKCKALGFSDAQLLALVLPMLDQIQGVSDAQG